jgi:CRP-like cAMP-binding protein
MWTEFYAFLALAAPVLLLLGFLSRNPMVLRGFAILGGLALIAYFYVGPHSPAWSAIIATALGIVVNIYIVAQSKKDSRRFRLTAEEMMLFARLPGLTPGQFKQLLDIAEWHTPKVSQQLTKLGEMPKALYYILEGQVEVNRENKRFSIGPHAFIGELAFLRSKPATATTFANAGAFVVSWEQDALRQLMQRNDGIRKAIDNLLSVDMAEKMANTSAPHLQEQASR